MSCTSPRYTLFEISISLLHNCRPLGRWFFRIYCRPHSSKNTSGIHLWSWWGCSQLHCILTHTPIWAGPKHCEHSQQVVPAIHTESRPPVLLQSHRWVVPPDSRGLDNWSDIVTLRNGNYNVMQYSATSWLGPPKGPPNSGLYFWWGLKARFHDTCSAFSTFFPTNFCCIPDTTAVNFNNAKQHDLHAFSFPLPAS